MVRIFSVIDLEIVDLEIIDLEIEVPEIPGTAGLRRAQNDPSWVKVYPGSDAPSLRGAEHGELRKHFVVNLGHQVVVAILVVAPDLPELDGLYRQSFPRMFAVSDYLPRMARVNCGQWFWGG
jgi:hypothetical protein